MERPTAIASAKAKRPGSCSGTHLARSRPDQSGSRCAIDIEEEEFVFWPLEEQRAFLESADREAAQRDKEYAVREKKEQKAEKDLLGPDCPRLEAKLFWGLCDGFLRYPYREFSQPPGPLSEQDLLSIVYNVDLWELKKPIQARFRNRLRTLQRKLQDRLRRRGMPFWIERPKAGHIQIHGPTTKPKPLSAAEREKREAARKRLEELLRKTAELPIGPLLTVQQCEDFLRRTLGDGNWQPIKELQYRCREADCRPSTFRRAMERLPTERTHCGFGKSGVRYVRLVKNSQKAQDCANP